MHHPKPPSSGGGAQCAHWAEGVSAQKCPKCIYCWPFPRYRAVPNGRAMIDKPAHASSAGTARRYRAGQGSNDSHRTGHAFAARLAGRAVPNGRAMIDKPAHASSAGTARRYRAVPHGLTTTAQLKNVKGVGTAHPPGAHFLVMPQESGERTALRGDAECHAPACQAALP